MINLTINDKQVSAKDGSTIIEAAIENDIYIPHLCYLKDVHEFGGCRICVVEVEGAKTLQASCVVPAREGMVVHTNTKKVKNARRVLYELLLSDHAADCLSCKRNLSCELQKLGKTLGITESRFEGAKNSRPIDKSVSITRDMSKCVLCRRCVTACNEVQGACVLNAQNRGFDTTIAPSMEVSIGEVNCAFCGQCTVVCPVGALKETDAIQSVWDMINDKDLRVIVQVAPAVRAAIGELFGMPAGQCVTGKMVSAMRALGFDDIFDTNWAADLTIMEEGTEFLHRITDKNATLPMITSCSPGWIKYVEHNFPTELDHLSTCKSPHTMFGAVAKSFYAQKIGIDPKNIRVVSIMPCTAKKFEITREVMQNDGMPNVDAVLTTREFGQMIDEYGIDFPALKDDNFDEPLGLSTGAADIFGLTGGVMEAALRTVYEIITGREIPFDKLHVQPIVGFDRVKEATIKLENVKEEYKAVEGAEVNIAVTSGLIGANQLMEEIAKGNSKYHFIEVMGCPGGCIMGGGQPRSTDTDIKVKRQQALYNEDESKVLRKSHENPSIVAIYQQFLENPGSHKAHELLHTSYTKRGGFNEYMVVDEVEEIKPQKERTKVKGVHFMEPKKAQEGPLSLKDLEAENARLRGEIEETKETVEIFKQVIEDLKK